MSFAEPPTVGNKGRKYFLNDIPVQGQQEKKTKTSKKEESTKYRDLIARQLSHHEVKEPFKVATRNDFMEVLVESEKSLTGQEAIKQDSFVIDLAQAKPYLDWGPVSEEENEAPQKDEKIIEKELINGYDLSKEDIDIILHGNEKTKRKDFPENSKKITDETIYLLAMSSEAFADSAKIPTDQWIHLSCNHPDVLLKRLENPLSSPKLVESDEKLVKEAKELLMELTNKEGVIVVFTKGTDAIRKDRNLMNHYFSLPGNLNASNNQKFKENLVESQKLFWACSTEAANVRKKFEDLKLIIEARINRDKSFSLPQETQDIIIDTFSFRYSVESSIVKEDMKKLHERTSQIAQVLEDLKQALNTMSLNIWWFKYHLSFAAHCSAKRWSPDALGVEKYFYIWYLTGYYKYSESLLIFNKEGFVVEIGECLPPDASELEILTNNKETFATYQNTLSDNENKEQDGII